jgi:quinol monooxygenase YgiN
MNARLMHARIFSAQFQEGKLEDVTQLVETSIIPAAKQQSGFHHLYWMTDPDTHKGVIVSIWDSEADRTASENNGFLNEQLVKLRAYVAAPPTVERVIISSHG